MMEGGCTDHAARPVGHSRAIRDATLPPHAATHAVPFSSLGPTPSLDHPCVSLVGHIPRYLLVLCRRVSCKSRQLQATRGSSFHFLAGKQRLELSFPSKQSCRNRQS